MINIITPPMSPLFEIHENIHNTRHFEVLSNENSRTVNNGLKSICYRASSLLAKLPTKLKK